MVGHVLGYYQIESKVGEGEFAVVYKGRDIRLDRMVAIKVLKERHPEDSSAWGRLLQEAKIASTLNHPNICTLYDIGEEQDVNYIVLELVEGKTLQAALNFGPLPTGTVFLYAIQTAEAIAHTHAAGILHLDLSSSNIMVTQSGRIKVIDFGLAKVMLEESTRRINGFASSAWEVGGLAGTLPYIAPEILHGETTTTQAGIWSLGVILFEMLTGKLPFAGHTPFELGMEVMTGSPDKLPSEIPSGLRSIVRRCLARDKGHRYCSAIEVLRHLKSEFAAYQIRSILAGRDHLENHWCTSSWMGSACLWLSLLFFGN